jgi:hypothetical protein
MSAHAGWVASSDDIVILGGSRQRPGQERDEAIEELFRGEYARLKSRAFAVLGESDQAEQVVIQAFADLWRHWRQAGDQLQALRYLQTAVTRLAREVGGVGGDRARGGVGGGRARGGVGGGRARGGVGGGRAGTEVAAVINGSAGRPPGAGIGGGSAGPGVSDEPFDVDTDRAWREFEALRARRTAARRRDLKALIGVAAIVAVAIAYPLLTSRRHANHASRAPRPPPVTLTPPAYPHAVVARLSLSGVISVAGVSAQAWAIRQIPRTITSEQPAAASTYQLVAIDLGTNDVTYRLNLGRRPRAIAAGAGRLWLTKPGGQAGGQIERIDPASGRVVQTLHLRAGSCSQLSFSSGQLYAACTAWPAGTGIWAINPASGRAVLLGNPVRGLVVSLVAAPGAVWYAHDYTRLGGRTRSSGRPIAVQGGPKYIQNPATPGTSGLAYDSGSIWALGIQERLIRIDEFTGKVLDTFNYRNYDPTRAGGLDFLTAADGWLWFLDNGYPFNGVLRVNEDTGQPAGGIWISPNSCGQLACSLIFATPGSIWVPTAELLIRIDPAAMPTQEPANRPDADSHLPS